jgi:hypothetical protein
MPQPLGGGGGVQPPPLLLELPPPVPQQLLELPLPALQLLEAAFLPDLAPLWPLAALAAPLPPDTNCISSKDKIRITNSYIKVKNKVKQRKQIVRFLPIEYCKRCAN